ncbi:MAG: ATP-binding protein [Bacteroidota bacterium]|nr:ATP-binding protein [Bacteroidota bacterium]
MIFIMDFFVNQRLSKEVVQNTSYISNSESVIRNSNMLHKDMIEMQSSFRGFLLTGQKNFLKPYYEGIASVPALMIQQKGLVSSELQVRLLDSIYFTHKLWLEYATDLINYRLDTFPESSKIYKELFETKLRMEVGKKLNDKIKTIFANFDNNEYKLRQERRSRLQSSIERTRTITLSLTLISILLAAISSQYFIRTITRRISKMVLLAERISKGDFTPMKENKKDELNELFLSLNSMSETLEKNFKDLTKKNNELDQFAYVVSHDLKAPLRGIANIVGWIEEDHENDITPGVKKNLDLIKGRTTRLENMINGLLEYARVGKVKKGHVKVDADLLVRDLVNFLVPKNFNVSINGKLSILTTEKLHIEQVFSNLLSNAVKYNRTAQPQITITSEEQPEYYKFTVEDNGPGIEKEYFEKIFIIFQTLQERDAFESTGVGLAIVKKIVEDYKGTINVESEIGKGSKFIFTWPK